MFVLIAGGGPTGAQLAALLFAQEQQVRLIEDRREVLARIHRELPTEVIYEGNATELRVLEQAGIRQAQVLVAGTPNDADNLVLCFLAHTLYAVPRIIGRINNPRNAWLFDQKFHVDVALNEATILAQLIAEEMSLGDMMTLLKLRRGEYSIVEEKVHKQASVVGKPLREISLPAECVFVAILRKNRLIVPHGDTVLEPVDEVIALVHSDQLAMVAALLGPQNQP